MIRAIETVVMAGLMGIFAVIFIGGLVGSVLDRGAQLETGHCYRIVARSTFVLGGLAGPKNVEITCP